MKGTDIGIKYIAPCESVKMQIGNNIYLTHYDIMNSVIGDGCFACHTQLLCWGSLIAHLVEGAPHVQKGFLSSGGLIPTHGPLLH